MRMDDEQESRNVDDRRASTGKSAGGMPSMRTMMFLWPIVKPLLKSKFGMVILGVGAVAYFMGFNPLTLLNSSSNNLVNTNQFTKSTNISKEQTQFVSAVLAQTEDVWSKEFKKHNAIYKEPKLVLFKHKVKSACGVASSQTGPFYCSADQKVYLDTEFFDQLAKRHDSPGDFAQGYVIAHEVGHHIQKLIGVLDKVHKQKRQVSKKEANRLQVKVELQAGCFAGMWANYLQKQGNILEDGDINEALRAATAIGDDTLQKQARGYVVPDSFTHGSSKSRKLWFSRGLEYGSMEACNTFKLLK